MEIKNMKINNKMNVKIDGELTDIEGYFVSDGKDGISLIHVRELESLIGAEIEFIDKENLNIKLEEDIIDLPLNVKICIDEGHGGKDGGAVDEVKESEGDFIRTLEKDLNNKVGNKVIKRLRDLGANVIIAREGDSTVSLYDRVKKANDANCDLYISIHFNAGSSAANGIETFKYRNTNNPISHKLTECIHNELIKATGFTNRGIKESGFYVIKYTKMPACLVELGFITNTKEEKIINTDDFQEKVASAIVTGILKTLED